MKALTDLLYRPGREGYPVEFVLARLGRRLAVFSSRSPVSGGEEAWQELQSEYYWLYSCLDRSFRKELAPVFLCFEMKNIYAAIRFAKAADKVGAESVLSASMLSPDLKAIFLMNDNPVLLLRELSASISCLDKGFAGLERLYLDKGLPVLEKAILGSLLHAAFRQGLCALTAEFLLSFLEKRNLVALAKEERWGGENFIPAVTHKRSTLRALEKKSRAISDREPQAAAEPARIDNLLLGAMAIKFHRLGRSGRALPKILDYILASYLVARNSGVKGLESILGNVRTRAEIVS